MSSVTSMTAFAMMLASCLCALPGVAASGQAPAAGSAAAKQADAAFHAGYAAANAGDLEQARRSFAEVVQLEPKIPEGHAALGSVLLNLGRTQEAATELKRGLALRPADREMKMNLALAEARSGQSSEALKLFQELAAAGSALPPEVEIGYAEALTETGRRPAALERLRAAVSTAPENAALHDALGSLLAQEQQWTAAQPEFARAVELDPKMVAARLHLGTVLMQLNQPAEAAATLELAHEQQPQDVDVLNQLALSYAAQGSYDKALPLAQEAMRLAPENSAAAYCAAGAGPRARGDSAVRARGGDGTEERLCADQLRAGAGATGKREGGDSAVPAGRGPDTERSGGA
jgi:tetratricopeptide (TPR) repeat protein